MNVWSEILSPALLALLYSAIFFFPAWLLYKWAAARNRLGVLRQFERPFRQGDWIAVGEYEGEIVEINWRATRLRTRQNIGIVIPNSVIAKAEIQNFNQDTPSAAVIPAIVGFSARLLESGFSEQEGRKTENSAFYWRSCHS